MELLHKIHFPISIIEELVRIISLRRILIQGLAIQVGDDMIQVHPVGQPVPILVGTIPFVRSDIRADVKITQLLFGNLFYDPPGNGQDLDLDILRDLAARYREHKGGRRREGIRIIQHVGDHRLIDDLEANPIGGGTRRISQFILGRDDQLINIPGRIELRSEGRREIHGCHIIVAAGSRREPERIAVEMIAVQRPVGILHLERYQRSVRKQQRRLTGQFYLDMRLGRNNIVVEDMDVVKCHVHSWAPAICFDIDVLIDEIVEKVLLRLDVRVEIDKDGVRSGEILGVDDIVEHQGIAAHDRPALGQGDRMHDIVLILDIHLDRHTVERDRTDILERNPEFDRLTE